MEYTIKKLAELAGISNRTLRYYDEIGLLKPCRINSSGYRIYGEKEVDLLQQILLFRGMDVPLKEIQQILEENHFDTLTLLKKHQQTLLSKKKHLDQLLHLVEESIHREERGEKMSDEAKFKALKAQMVQEKDATYGEEAREKYGVETIEASNQKILNWQPKDLDIFNQNQDTLKTLLLKKDEWQIPSAEAEAVYLAHKNFLMSFLTTPYDPNIHLCIANLYVEDPRFTAYYEEFAGENTAEILQAVIAYYAK